MRYRYRVNLAGIVYLGITFLVGISATIRPNNILVWVFGLLLALIGIGGLISGAALYRMSIRRLDPGPGRVGQPLVVRYAIRGGSRRLPIFDVSIAERPGDSPSDWSTFARLDPAWLMHAAPGEVGHAETVLVPSRRGRMHLDGISASSSFPFGLLDKIVRTRQPMETLVYPRTIPLQPSAIERMLASGSVGARSSRRTGAVGEYTGVREYRPGDSVRSLARRRWLHDDAPVVVERSAASPRRVQLLLDLRRATEDLRVEDGVDVRALEERAITLAGSLAESGILSGIEVGLRIDGLRLPELPVQGGRRHLERILGVLGGIDLAETRTPRQGIVPQPRSGSLVVIHVDRVDTGLGHDEAHHLLPDSLDRLVAGGRPEPNLRREAG